MGEGLERYRRKRARSEFRGDLAYPILAFGSLGLVATGYGVVTLPSSDGWISLASGAVSLVLAYGLWACWLWIRWPAVVLFATGAVVEIAGLVHDPRDATSWIRAFVLSALTLDLASPTTRALLARANAAAPSDAAELSSDVGRERQLATATSVGK